MGDELFIGLVGRKKTGKDTFFEIASRELGPGVCERFAFGDLLKKEMARGLRVSVDLINDNKDAFRAGLQWWGTDFRRNLCWEGYWVQELQCSPAFQNRFRSGVKFITDIRFLNEAAFVMDRGGILVRMIRPLPGDDTHQSESEQDQIACDYEILNDGPLGLLEANVLNVLPVIVEHARRRFASLQGDVTTPPISKS